MSDIYEKLDRVRKPRVHIKYEVEKENTVEKKELPFVVGVLGDFSGDSRMPIKPLKERKFVQIDHDNFNDVMARIKPGLQIKVANKLQNNDSEMMINLKFDCLEDFAPDKIVAQVPALQRLLNKRNQLRDLLTKVDRSEKLEDILETALKDSQNMQKIVKELADENNAKK